MNMKNIAKNVYLTACQKVGTMLAAPSARQIQLMLFAIGGVLLVSGLSLEAMAAASSGTTTGTGTGTNYTAVANYNDDRIAEAANVIMAYINGSFGALVMIACGVGAILSSAFGQYRAALGLMVVAVGSFILRSLVNTWFNTVTMGEAGDGDFNRTA